MGGTRRVRVFLNAGSGTGGTSASEVCRAFAAEGWGCEVTPLRPELDWAALGSEDGAEVVWVAAGGDGTVNAVASACMGSERTMGVLPIGTLNHFARDLGLPVRLDEAICAVCRGTGRGVDAAEANGEWFVNNSSLGVYPAMVLDRDRMCRKGASKWWAMVKASARAFVRFRCLDIELQLEETVRRCRTALLFVGNNRYDKAGGRLGQRVHLDEGVLSVAVVTGATRWGMSKVFAAALFGRAKEVGELEEFLVREFKVRARGRRRLRVSFDGEVKRMEGPIRYRIHAGALQVMVPEREAV
jgi:diacylglycerol kinase family enzyme